MKAQLCTEFVEDEYIEPLIKQRESNPAAYHAYPQAVRDTIDEYEREKKAARKDKPDQK